MPALNAHLSERLRNMPDDSLRHLVQAVALPQGKLQVSGALYHHFSGNDYLGLCHHPQVIDAAKLACDDGAGAGASRLVTGNHPRYAALEAALATHTRMPRACVFSSGYAATVGTISALMGKGDLILADKLAHACMIDGAKLSGARLMRFAHNDSSHAEALLSAHRSSYNNVLIITEHVFSMDGDIAPLDNLITLKNNYDCWLMVDDAHGIGIVDYSSKHGVDIWCGTLSKALASVGGYIAGSEALVQYVTQHARSLIFSTALPPSALAAALAALERAYREPERGQRARAHARNVTQALGLPYAQSAIVPVVLGSNARALEASAALKNQGFWVSAIRPPTVPKGSARLRITLSAAHDDAQVQGLIDALKPWVLA